MDELQKSLEEIKANIERLRIITDSLSRQKKILDKLDKIDKLEKLDKEVI